MKMRIGFLANHSATSYIVYIPAWYTEQCLIDDLKEFMIDDEDTGEERPLKDGEIKTVVDAFNECVKNGGYNHQDESTLELGDGEDALETILQQFVIKDFSVQDGDGSFELITQEEVDNINRMASNNACTTPKK